MNRYHLGESTCISTNNGLIKFEDDDTKIEINTNDFVNLFPSIEQKAQYLMRSQSPKDCQLVNGFVITVCKDADQHMPSIIIRNATNMINLTYGKFIELKQVLGLIRQQM